MGKGKKIQIFDEGNPEELFEKHECLGEGTYGTVWTGKEKSTGRTCAIKIVKIDDDLEEIEQEVAIMKESDSPYVVKFYGCYWGKGRKTIWMVMEHCVAGSLNDLMYVCDTTLSEPQIKAVSAAMVLGLEYLHKNLIIHRDIKAGNVLLTDAGEVRLADFGVSAKMKSKSDKKTTAIGAPFWMAPEVINEEKYDGRADIWSLGITVIELAEARPPNSHINPMRALFLIPQQPPPGFKNPEKWSNDMKDFVKVCLTKNPGKRPIATTLKKHPFIANEVKEFQSDGRCREIVNLVNSSLQKIQTWRAEHSDDEEEEEEEEEEEGIDNLLDEMEDKNKVAPRKVPPVKPVNIASKPSLEGKGAGIEKAPSKPYVSPYGDLKVRDSVRQSQSVVKPLRDVVDPGKENPGKMLSARHNGELSISDEAIHGFFNMESKGDGDAGYAAVISTEIISIIKKIYASNPDAFGGKDASQITGEDVSTAMVNALVGLVGEVNIQGTEKYSDTKEEDFDDSQWNEDEEPPPPPLHMVKPLTSEDV